MATLLDRLGWVARDHNKFKTSLLEVDLHASHLKREDQDVDRTPEKEPIDEHHRASHGCGVAEGAVTPNLGHQTQQFVQVRLATVHLPREAPKTKASGHRQDPRIRLCVEEHVRSDSCISKVTLNAACKRR